MKTIKVNGKIYEVGKLYFCNETERYGGITSSDSELIFMENRDAKWHTHTISKVERFNLGEVKDAPIEPKDKHWYMCEDYKGRQGVLYYRNCGWLDSQQNPVSEVTPLYEMVRA